MTTRIFLILISVLMAFKAQAEGDKPAAWVLDMPLMQDMLPAPEQSFSFDSAAGRVLVVYATSPASETALARFYTDSLSALGWSGSWPVFTRRAEQLVFVKEAVAGQDYWKMTLSPRVAAPAQ